MAAEKNVKILWHLTVPEATEVTLTARDVTSGSRLTWFNGNSDRDVTDVYRGQTLPGSGAGPGGSGSNLPSGIRPQQAKRVLVEASADGLDDELCLSFGPAPPG